MSVNFQTSACKARASFGLNSGKRLSESLPNHQPAALLQRGFTLIELLAVITLLAIIATITTMSISDVGAQAQDDLSLVEMTEIRKAVLQFKRDVGHFPDSGGTFGVEENDDESNLGPFRLRLLWDCQNELAAIPADPLKYNYDEGCSDFNVDTRRGWNGPYVLQEHSGDLSGIYDPWGNHYRLFDPAPGSGTTRIVSFGPDQTDNGDNGCLPNGDDVVLCLVQ